MHDLLLPICTNLTIVAVIKDFDDPLEVIHVLLITCILYESLQPYKAQLTCSLSFRDFKLATDSGLVS